MRRLASTCALALIAGLGVAADGASAAPPPPIDLHVGGGSETWHPGNRFRLFWDNPTDATPPVVAVHYRVRRPDEGGVAAEARIDWAAEDVEVRVPSFPGSYTAEVWLEDGEGAQGAPASTHLRYDNTRPEFVAAEPAPDWISRTAFPLTVRLSHPQEPLPVSGIGGYAVSVDRDPLGSPCADTFLCEPTETDLQAGIDGDSIQIPRLPDGVSYVHAVAVSGAGVRSALVGHTAFRVDTMDPSTAIEGVPAGWVSRPVPLTARAADADSGMAAGTGAFTAIRVDDGAPVVAAGTEVRATVITEGVHSIAYYARDSAGNVNDGAAANGDANAPAATATVKIDRTPPRVVFSNSQAPEDPEEIRVRVEDPLSGAGTDGSIGVRVAGSGDRFEALPTAATAAGLRARWNSDAYPSGSYEFRAIGSDAAGNVSTSSSRADGGPMVLSNPVKAPSVLTAGLGTKGRKPARTLPFGGSARFSGRLTTGSRRPMESAPVRIVERDAGSGAERTQTVLTDADGSFAVRLPAGPSREVFASFRGSRTFAASSARPARMLVRSGVRMRVSASVARIGGAPVIFSGVVKAGPARLPAGGKSVELQFRLPGLPWQEFRTVQSDGRGRFRYAYRFSDDDSRGVTFQFRAHATAQGDWPYEPGDSRPVAVRGR